MIEDKFVDLYARNSGLRDKLVAERDVVLTYALRGLTDDGVMDHLAFKGGTCLRKMIFGSAGRFSEDLDFTLDSDCKEDDVLIDLVESRNQGHGGLICFATRTQPDGVTRLWRIGAGVEAVHKTSLEPHPDGAVIQRDLVDQPGASGPALAQHTPRHDLLVQRLGRGTGCHGSVA